MLTLEQRAFLAGMVLSEGCGTGYMDGSALLGEVNRIETVAAQEVTPERWTAFIGYQAALLRMSEFFAAEEAQRSAALARGGPDVSKPLTEWGAQEWRAAVTAFACYRYYLQRELSAVNDFLCSDPVQKAPELAQLADDAAATLRQNFREENMPTVDPAWARKLLRRIIVEAQSAT